MGETTWDTLYSSEIYFAKTTKYGLNDIKSAPTPEFS